MERLIGKIEGGGWCLGRFLLFFRKMRVGLFICFFFWFLGDCIFIRMAVSSLLDF